MNKVIQPIHVYCLLFLSVSFLAHFILIPTIFTIVEREAWISALASLIPILILAFLISRIINKLNNTSFFEQQFSQDNRPLYLFIITSYIMYLISSTFVSLKFTIIWAEESFNSDYPYFITVILFILLCFYGSLKGIKTIAILSLIICSLYIFLFVLLNLGNSMNNEYELLLPVNTSNTPSILWGILYICIGILEMGFILIVLNSYVKEQMKRTGILVFSSMFVLLVFIAIVTTVSEFGIYLTKKMLFPINEQWRVLSFGKYFTRLDSLSVLQILSMAFIRICLFMYIVSSFFKNRKFILIIGYLSLTIGLLIPWSVSDFLSFIKSTYLLSIFLFLFFFMTVFYVLEKKQKGVHHLD
ncbi:GerAB/ArcD/ProY family transporter [Lysinibacillus fusiformis]|uniref:GerAB/ArcD/ProY family transporter n=2 Tax=Lysinibacillus fusiformis TaxID=28031 RepID=UPI000889B183|nr:MULTISPECIES: GerAB/ArcD/ProY family transporter [Lysinibacillus]MED4671521.1 GerAB/ArcD/ProY family transporter [Lysinibacillus fusiformis]QAS55038.1 spore gernimation protein [Lysinibacillus sphaericus]SCX38616.1 Spore germination protein [Lysinibacillus fusiformis]SDB05955.1 Spore germination protein [Lysinibacillus fusiformis]SFH76248.1 Spore germination protein [Lysinibacillus fusiformis]